jgi:hypothetical protein
MFDTLFRPLGWVAGNAESVFIAIEYLEVGDLQSNSPNRYQNTKRGISTFEFWMV